jgi:HEAT repeat protein
MLWLVELKLRSADPYKRAKAAERLYAAGKKRASRAFQRALSHSNPEVRQTAINGLCKVADGASIPTLIKVLGDKDPEVVKPATLALRGNRTPEVRTAVAALLRHKDAGVRGTAAQILPSMHWQPGTPQDHAWFLTARGAFAPAVAEHGALALAPLHLVINNGPCDLSVRAVEALGKIPSPEVPAILLRALNSAHPGVCIAAIDALGGLGGPEIVEPLMQMLGHVNANVRVSAIEVLGRARVSEAVDTLARLARDREWDVRRAAVEALGRIRHKKGLEALVRSLDDSDQDVREAAVRGLGNLRERRAIGPLLLRLCDKETSVRRIAAASLSRIAEDWSASPEAFAMVDKIKLLLQDGDQEVRRRAMELLASLMAAQQSRSVGNAEHATLAVALFVDILRDQDADLRLAAAEALSRLALAEGQAALEHAVNDPDRNVREAAERGLVLLRLGVPETLAVSES